MRLPAIGVLTDSTERTGKIFSINWGKAYSNHLFSGTPKPGVPVISGDEEDYCYGRSGVRPEENNQRSGLCL